MIYLDNAATSFPKPSAVYESVENCLKNYCGNPGRSSHALSVKAAETIYEARERVCSLIGATRPENTVFTYNATYALNLALKSFITEKCHLLVSDVEHNSVIRPLQKLKRTLGIEYSLFESESAEESIRKNIRKDTAGIISTLSSNVTGQVISLHELSKVSRENGLFLIVDSSQLIGHRNIDLSKTPCECLCAPGHKALFGIQGCGFAYFASNIRKNTLVEGGSGSDSMSSEMPTLLPEGYEAGTLGTPAIASLESGIRFIENVGINVIETHISLLTDLLHERIKAIPKAKIYSAENGIVSFSIGEVPSSVIADELDRFGICVRGGLHCAPSAHKKLGTLNTGTVRASLSFLNTIAEIDCFYKTLGYIATKY